jgi:hypothetical protein
MRSVFEKFGGIRPMAAKLGLPSSTVKSWHVSRKIPTWRHGAILDAARAAAIDLAEDELTSVRPDQGERSAA